MHVPDILKGGKIFFPVSGWMIACREGKWRGETEEDRKGGKRGRQGGMEVKEEYEQKG